MKTLVIIDSQGPDGITESYRAALPNCTIEGHEPEGVAGQPCHPHGLFCGHLAGLVQSWDTRLIFLRIFGGPDAASIPGATDWALDMLEKLELPPLTVISRSWGMAPRGFAAKAMGPIWYAEWVARYTDMLRRNHWVDFGASGNSDENDKQPDVSFPQALMPELCNIIGASDRTGRPSVFSSDGDGVQCLMWGERILLRGAHEWSAGSGTSFACPKAAGVCCEEGLSDAGWKKLVADSAPEGWAAEEPWHPKYGWGNREHLWQRILMNRIPAHLWPRAETQALFLGGAASAPEWHDFERINTEGGGDGH